MRGCAAGLACVDHQCEVASCAEAGCSAAAPACNIATDVCDPCADAADCSRFADTPVCEPSSGSCVQCVAASDCAMATPVCDPSSSKCVQCVTSQDCPVTAPVCDANACRTPATDDECDSGALSDEGGCVAESAVVYLSPIGSDAGSCSKTLPCRSLAFGVTRTTTSRHDIVFASGTYSTAAGSYGSADTQASSLFIHGHGAEIRGPSAGEGCIAGLGIAISIRDLSIVSTLPNSLSALCIEAGPSTLEHVTVAAGTGVEIGASTTVRDYRQTGGYIGFNVASALVLDRATIVNVDTAVESVGSSNITVQLSNLLVYGSTRRALDFTSGTSGTVTSSTFVTSGAGSVTTGARSVQCPSTVLVRSSIVWAPNAGRVPLSGCNLTDVIAGPTSVPGATNVDPMFVALGQNDYHLAAGSPARDAVSTGPALDFEGDPRPQGAMFDIGADEAAP